MKWRWYTTWWLLPCVPSHFDHHDLSFLPFCAPSFPIFPPHFSSHFPFSSSSYSSWRANTTVPRASSSTPPSGSSVRRTLYLHHQIHLGFPRGARIQTAASGFAGGLRQIGHQVTRIHSGYLVGWLADS